MIIENLTPISLSSINRILNLKAIGTRSQVINIRAKNNGTGKVDDVFSIYATLHSDTKKSYLVLQYYVVGSKMKQTIEIDSQENNLGKRVHYFRCTGNRCRKMYLVGDQFVGRKAIEHLLYRTQSETKNKRNRLWKIRTIIKLSRLIQEGQDKRSKKYRGKATLRQTKVVAARRLLEQF
ncbi:MAG TPA: hypothetical protein VK588_02220 [Chitinophagaceae bacterium]|nr:hypothetical protein [Chitinophagaceae bacterium]